MGLKDKKDIEDYEMKAKVLRDNEFETWFHDDNWVHRSSFESEYGPDRAGCSTDAAYNSIVGKGELDDLVEVKSIPPDFRYKQWTTVRRVLAARLQDIEVREIV